MSRWMREERKARLRELIDQGVPRAAIIARMSMTPGQFTSQCRIMHLSPVIEGMSRVYKRLQGVRKSKKGAKRWDTQSKRS